MVNWLILEQWLLFLLHKFWPYAAVTTSSCQWALTYLQKKTSHPQYLVSHPIVQQGADCQIWIRTNVFRFPVHSTSSDTKHFCLTNMAPVMGWPKPSCFPFRAKYLKSQRYWVSCAQGNFPLQPVKCLKFLPDNWKGLAWFWKGRSECHVGRKDLVLIRPHKSMLRGYSFCLWFPKSVFPHQGCFLSSCWFSRIQIMRNLDSQGPKCECQGLLIYPPEG